jgi:hypothetical protein
MTLYNEGYINKQQLPSQAHSGQYDRSLPLIEGMPAYIDNPEKMQSDEVLSPLGKMVLGVLFAPSVLVGLNQGNLSFTDLLALRRKS